MTDGKGTYKPLPIETGNYKDLGVDSDPLKDYKYAGVLYRSILNGEPAAIMTAGQVNKVAAKAANGTDYPNAFLTAMPKITRSSIS